MSNIANAQLQYSQTGLQLTEEFEAAGGPILKAIVPVPGDPWTIGYGRTRGVTEGMTCTPQQAVDWLMEDLAWAVNAVKQYVNVPLTQGQFDALVDFTYNEGAGNLASSTMLKLLNAGQPDAAWAELTKWDMAHGVHVAGLLRRRVAEQAEWKGA